MDKTGRRTLHLYGLGGMFIFSIFITISFLIKASKKFHINVNSIQNEIMKIMKRIYHKKYLGEFHHKIEISRRYCI